MARKNKKKPKSNYPDVLHPIELPAAKAEQEKRLEDKGKAYEIRFDFSDVEGFYDNRAVLPVAAFWNMDEFLIEYLIVGIDSLLNGVTDWNSIRDSAGRNARKQLIRARDLLIKQREARKGFGAREPYGDAALRIIADIGMNHLWD